MATDGSRVGQRVSRYIVSCRRRLSFEVLVVRRIVGQAAGYNKGRDAPSSIVGIPPSAHGEDPCISETASELLSCSPPLPWLRWAWPSSGCTPLRPPTARGSTQTNTPGAHTGSP